VTTKDLAAIKTCRYTALCNISFQTFSETLFKKRPLLLYSIYQQITNRYLTNVNPKVAQSLLIAYVIIICAQSVCLFSGTQAWTCVCHCLMAELMTDCWSDSMIQQCTLATRRHLECYVCRLHTVSCIILYIL